MSKSKSTPKILTIDEIAETIRVEPPCAVAMDWDFGDVYGYAYNEALKAGATEAEAEEKALAAESRESDEVWNKYTHAVMQAAESLFAEHDLVLKPVSGWQYKLVPRKSWRGVCAKLIETINGYGLFGFRDVGEFCRSMPGTPKETAISHLHWIGTYPDVFGTYSAKYKVERAMRY